MAELQRSVATSQVYERLIDRLSVALDSAKTAVQLRDERPVELELRGLSHAEAIKRSQGSVNMQDAPRAKVIWLKDRVQGA